MQRLGRNHGRYFGETIDIARVTADALAAARRHGWSVTMLDAGDVALPALTRRARIGDGGDSISPGGARRIYVSTGIHGDEPAGPLAVRQLLEENAWPADADLWLCPCLNPTGFALNTRENAAGVDLNRGYREPSAPEVRAHVAWLEAQPAFDVAFCLHEDWEAAGFYLYELNPDGRPSLAEAMVAAVARVCPIDPSALIEEREARGGIIRPNLDPAQRPQWPEAFYLGQRKTRLGYTLEAPSDFPLPVRVAALRTGVRAALAVAPSAQAG